MKPLLMTILSAVMLFSVAHAADSPQFRGPNRDGIFPETNLLDSWPEGGPPVAWMAEGIGEGFSSVVVVGGLVYVPGVLNRDDGYIFVLDGRGNVQARIPYGKETLDRRAPGARSTPTIDGDRLYILSGLGVVYCLQLPQGNILWQVNILERFGGENNTWNLAESLLVDGDRLICTPGGPDAGVVALNKMTGETVWTTEGLSDQASYCSPVIVRHGARRLLLTMTATLVVGIDADTGELLWTHGHRTDYDIHAVSPLYQDGLIYYTGGYGSGGGVLELSPDGASVTLKWTDENLDCQHHGVVLLDGYLYGTGHQNNRLMCLEMTTGRLMWSTREVKQGVVIAADGMLYVYEGPRAGVVSLVKATPTGFERTGSFVVTEGTNEHWAHPMISGGLLYIRRGNTVIAYDIRQK